MTDVSCGDVSGRQWVALSNGMDAFTGGGLWKDAGCVGPGATRIAAGDFNGDGKGDIYCHGERGNTWVALSNGTDAFTSEGLWLGNWCAYAQFGTGDFNGDGKTDVFCHEYGGNNWVALSNGMDAFIRAASPWLGNWCAYAQFGTGDFNGDGKTDVFCHGIYTDNRTWVAKSGSLLGITDLLARVSNSIGGTTTIEYKPSTVYSNTQLPFPVQTVSSVTANDGNSVVSTTKYEYSGGFYDFKERDFRGFNHVTVTSNATGPTSEQKVMETWFHQGNDTAVDANDPNVSVAYMKESRIVRGSEMHLVHQTYIQKQRSVISPSLMGPLLLF